MQQQNQNQTITMVQAKNRKTGKTYHVSNEDMNKLKKENPGIFSFEEKKLPIEVKEKNSEMAKTDIKKEKQP